MFCNLFNFKNRALSAILFIYLIMSIFILSVSANEEQMRIEAHQVNIDNYEQFVEQIKRELPVGTPIQNVKAYLAENKIKYGYSPQVDYLQFMIKKIRSSFFIFNTDLQLKIYFNEKTGVTEIKSRLVRTAL